MEFKASSSAPNFVKNDGSVEVVTSVRKTLRLMIYSFRHLIHGAIWWAVMLTPVSNYRLFSLKRSCCVTIVMGPPSNVFFSTSAYFVNGNT